MHSHRLPLHTDLDNTDNTDNTLIMQTEIIAGVTTEMVVDLMMHRTTIVTRIEIETRKEIVGQDLGL